MSLEPSDQLNARATNRFDPPGSLAWPDAPVPGVGGVDGTYTAPGPSRAKVKRLGGAAIGAGLLGLKFAGSLKALVLVLPKLKLLTTAGSMLASIAAYSLLWGVKFAVGFVLLLLVHELGHVFQLRREGIRVQTMMFVPFMGAFISSKSVGGDAAAEARIGLAGPILGSAAAALLMPIGTLTGNEMFTALAFVGFFLNLFNLLPIVPLDGGRAMAALSPKMWIVGFAMLLALTALYPNPILLLILLLGGFTGWQRWKTRHSPENPSYYKVSTRDRLAIATVYIGLIALLAAGMAQTHVAT